jgi:hypothetical protein
LWHKRGKKPVRDFELENLAVDDIRNALEYIGKIARSKNFFLGNNSKKQKTDSLYSVTPTLFVSHEILNNPKQLTESKSCH